MAKNQSKRNRQSKSKGNVGGFAALTESEVKEALRSRRAGKYDDLIAAFGECQPGSGFKVAADSVGRDEANAREANAIQSSLIKHIGKGKVKVFCVDDSTFGIFRKS